MSCPLSLRDEFGNVIEFKSEFGKNVNYCASCDNNKIGGSSAQLCCIGIVNYVGNAQSNLGRIKNSTEFLSEF